MASKSYDWDVRNIAKISPKMAKKQSFFDIFRFSQKLSIRFERNFLQLFYTILESYMCNGIKIVWRGCEKHSQNWPKIGQKNSFFNFFRFSQKLSLRFERNLSICEKDLSRLFYRICGSGIDFFFHVQIFHRVTKQHIRIKTSLVLVLFFFNTI